jgi:hypothetical protein
MIDKKKRRMTRKNMTKQLKNKSYTTKSLDHGWDREEHNDIVESKI